jgi:vacuolar iron transporter family protein
MTGPLDSWESEKQASYLYRVLSEVEAGSPRAELFRALAAAAEEQAVVWAEETRKAGDEVPSVFSPRARARLVAALIRRLGPRRLRPVLAAMKVRGISVYSRAQAGHAMPQSVAEVGRRHKGANQGGNLRAAVFGVNDGLVSNTSLILGVAGAAASPSVVLLSGVAGLLAGAFSMAAGEYVSVRSQREMFEYQIGLERDELAQYPKEEAAELALIYAARGIPREDAKKLAQRIIADPERALDTLAREELGLDPDELGSPISAAAFSFVSFAAGAVVPLLPFLLARSTSALPIAIALAGAALFGVGAVLSLYTGRRALRGGLRMLAIGAAAGGATYLIGRLLGVAVS